MNPIKNQMKFHALAISCNHLNYNKILKIGEQYNYYVSFSSMVESVTEKHFFHVFLVSQTHKNHVFLVEQIKFKYPNSIIVLLLEELDDTEYVNSLIQQKIFFFILNKETPDMLEVSLHQLWSWLLEIQRKHFSIHSQTSIAVAGGILSLQQETYTKYSKVHHLTGKQVAMLKVFLEYRGQTVSRTQLLNTVWDVSKEKVVTDRVIDTNIVSLRKMFDDEGRNPKYLQTIFGQGYRLNLE